MKFTLRFSKVLFALTLMVMAVTVSTVQKAYGSTEQVAQAVEQTLQETPVDDSVPEWQVVAGLLLIVLEIAFRLFPTTKDISILGFIYRALNFLIPNKSTETEVIETPKGTRKLVRKIFRIKK